MTDDLASALRAELKRGFDRATATARSRLDDRNPQPMTTREAAMHNDDERDELEEAANRELLRNPDPDPDPAPMIHRDADGVEVSPLGDRREREVACSRCRRGTWNVSALCDACLDPHVADVPALVPDAEDDRVPDEEIDEHDVAELALLVRAKLEAGTMDDVEAVDLGLGVIADDALVLNTAGRAVVKRILEDVAHEGAVLRARALFGNAYHGSPT